MTTNATSSEYTEEELQRRKAEAAILIEETAKRVIKPLAPALGVEEKQESMPCGFCGQEKPKLVSGGRAGAIICPECVEVVHHALTTAGVLRPAPLPATAVSLNLHDAAATRCLNLLEQVTALCAKAVELPGGEGQLLAEVALTMAETAERLARIGGGAR